mmetsp:Transcript_54525/g.132365  ORF Transcript_54525/g.132365 Transcript_54525/m.132365 type:complete len:227 (+) Transcript_54525:2472-3152(+)
MMSHPPIHPAPVPNHAHCISRHSAHDDERAVQFVPPIPGPSSSPPPGPLSSSSHVATPHPSMPHWLLQNPLGSPPIIVSPVENHRQVLNPSDNVTDVQSSQLSPPSEVQSSASDCAVSETSQTLSIVDSSPNVEFVKHATSCGPSIHDGKHSPLPTSGPGTHALQPSMDKQSVQVSVKTVSLPGPRSLPVHAASATVIRDRGDEDVTVNSTTKVVANAVVNKDGGM